MQTTKLTKEEQKAQSLEVKAAREKIHALVVKIISWKNGLLDGGSVQQDNKITPQEWQKYKTHLLEISKIESVEAVKEKLAQTYEAIKKHGGFK